METKERELNQLGENVRVQGGQGTGAMTELIYNEATGEFETKRVGSEISGARQNVTEMTHDGFAYDA